MLTAWTKSLLTGHRVEFGSDAGLSAAHDLALLPRDWKKIRLRYSCPQGMGNIAGRSIARCHSAMGAATTSTSKI